MNHTTNSRSVRLEPCQRVDFAIASLLTLACPAALRWVKRHIGAFGGDSDRITLFGHGAGARDGCYQMVAGRSEALFHAAVLEGGSCALATLSELPEAETVGEALAAAAGCDDDDTDQSLACLRQQRASDLVKLDDAGRRGGGESAGLAVVDGKFLMKQPRTAIAAGDFLHVPAILGTTSHEAATYFAENRQIESDAQYMNLLEDSLDALAAEAVASRYPLDQFASPNDAAIAVATDALFACPARRLASRLGSDEPVFLYHFARSVLVDPFYGLGSTHGGELLWVWNVWPILSPYAAEEVDYSGWLRGFWTSLTSGDVNAASRPEWPRYSRDMQRELAIDDAGFESIELSPEPRCDVWDAAPAMIERLAQSLDRTQ